MIKESRLKGNNTSRTQENCTDWYLVTTIYYTDGSTSQEWEYLTTTCTGCDCGNIQCECPDDPGENNSIGEYDYEVRRSVTWTVAANAAWGSGSEIVGQETLKGKRVASQPQGGYFTGITHYPSICNFCNINYPYDVWVETSWSGSASGQSASSTVVGYINYRSNRFDINNTGFWSFSAVFP